MIEIQGKNENLKMQNSVIYGISTTHWTPSKITSSSLLEKTENGTYLFQTNQSKEVKNPWFM